MCGIAGIMRHDGGPVLYGTLRRMCEAMRHRGPDDEGIYLGACAGLGMRRLSIIDLHTGSQPIRNEDGSVWVVLNGEIYNYRELRADLESRGHVFATASDTETIVHLYEEDGPRCVERLRGMYAFAVWDERRRQLLLARDRLGVKPLYYAETGHGLVFASELKALLQLPEVRSEIDWGAAGRLFTFLTTPASQSIVRGVRKLEPGQILISSPGGRLRLASYWDVRFEPDRSRTVEETADRLRELLLESVRLRMVSDVPVGAFLSGGVDSSAVVAHMARLSSGPVRTFSIGFKEGGFDETPYARTVAKLFETEHHELILEPDALDLVQEIVWHLDEPFGDSSAIPTYMVSRLAAGHVKVVLSGDGGDELFAGYDRYLVEARRRAAPGVPRPIGRALAALARALPDGAPGRNFLRNLSLPAPSRYLDSCSLFAADQKRSLFRPEVYREIEQHDPWQEARQVLARPDRHWLSTLQYLDLKSYLPLDIMTKVDRMSMAHSLEAREPLLDHRLVEFAATIPPDMLIRGGTTKWILKRALRGVLPDAILDRPKRGFAVPLARWFRGRLSGFARDLLLSSRCRERGVFNPDYVARLLSMHDRGRDLDLQIWTALSFELWCRTFLDGRSIHREDGSLSHERARPA